MSDFGAYEDDMARFSKLSDRDVERLLSGRDLAGDGELDELAAFVRTVSALATAPDEATEARHVQAMVQAAQASRTGDLRSGSEARTSEVSPRRRLVLRNPLSSFAAKLLAAVVVVLALFAGAASAGKLPGGVQGSVSDMAGNVGISLPDDDEGDIDDGDVNNVDDGAVNDVDDGPQGNVDDGAQNNVDDGPRGNVDDGAQNNVDDGAQGNVDDGAQNNVDDGSQNNVDDGQQGDVDDGDQGDDRPQAPAPQAPPPAPAPQNQGNQGNGNGNQGNGDN